MYFWHSWLLTSPTLATNKQLLPHTISFLLLLLPFFGCLYLWLISCVLRAHVQHCRGRLCWAPVGLRQTVNCYADLVFGTNHKQGNLHKDVLNKHYLCRQILLHLLEPKFVSTWKKKKKKVSLLLDIHRVNSNIKSANGCRGLFLSFSFFFFYCSELTK